MAAWRIYYADGSVFDDTMGGPGDAPARGILSIKQRLNCLHHPEQWLKSEGCHNSVGPVLELLEGADWYFWADGRWFRTDLMGFIDQAMHCGAGWLKQGRYITHEVWENHIVMVNRDSL